MNHHDRFFLASNNAAESQHDQREILRVLQASPDQDKIAQYFYERTRKLIVSKSYTLANNEVKYVDIINEVLRYVPLYWTASELVCNCETVF